MQHGWVVITRYYVCPIIGDGSKSNPYRAAVADHGVSYVSVIQSVAAGTPSKSWTVCRVDADDHATLLADARLKVLPNDGEWTDAVRTTLSAMTSITLNSTDTTRDVITKLGQAHVPTFDPAVWVIDGRPSN
jgi:hypothetical protein